MRAALWVANILGWPLIHVCIAKLAISLPADYFARDGALLAERRWERGGRFYHRWFAIRRWKALLPDGAPWLGGFTKKRLARGDKSSMEVFLLETRRAELAHWCMLACTPLFFLWNPPWACCVMAAYGIAANVPCILAQRYNRIALSRFCKRSRERRPTTA